MLNETFYALSDPTRRSILDLLKKKDLSAGEIGSNFKITAPSMSHHLSVLRRADLIIYEKRGQERVYSLNTSVFDEIAKNLSKFFNKK